MASAGANIGRLRNLDLFAGLPDQAIRAILHRGVIRNLKKNSVFIEKDDESSTLHLILSGSVKVYVGDGAGGEKVLGVLGPGQHLGELALLADSVRTASAVTLEDSSFLVLSRRVFLDVLSENTQIALNLDHGLADLTHAFDDEQPDIMQYRGWSAFRRSGLPLVILIGGCTGTGKSTIAAELALRLDIGRTQSTDILREIVRLFIPRETAPDLHASSFDAGKALHRPKPAEEGSKPPHMAVTGLLAQSDRLRPSLDEVIGRSIKERTSIIVEGVHIPPTDYWQKFQQAAVVVSVLLTIPSKEKLQQHFLRRGELAPSRGAQRYLKYLDTIWDVQEYLISEAIRHKVPIVSNQRVEDTVNCVIQEITDILVERFGLT